MQPGVAEGHPTARPAYYLSYVYPLAGVTPKPHSATAKEDGPLLRCLCACTWGARAAKQPPEPVPQGMYMKGKGSQATAKKRQPKRQEGEEHARHGM